MNCTMMRKNKVWLYFLFLLLLVSCNINNINDSDENGSKEKTVEQIPESDMKNYAMFSLNVHDWVFPEQSIETINRVIDIHEKYNVPIDIYLTDPTLHNYVDMAPDVVERLKTSSVVSISYHFRPPYPAYSHFDTIGLEDMDEEEAYETLLAYEEHKLNLETGGYYENETGGYQFVKDTIGYAPLAVGFSAFSTRNANIANALARIYAEKGAFFYVEHRKDSELLDMNYGFYLRPEHVEIKWYEKVHIYINDNLTAEDIIADMSGTYEGRKGIFINIKMHENNFYTTATPFWPIYWVDADKTIPQHPPYNTNAAAEVVQMKSQETQDAMWKWYESAVAYVAEHPELFIPINNEGVKKMIEEAQ